MKRAIIVVIDSLGIGAMGDAPKYNDLLSCNTLGNLSIACGGLRLPTLERMGLGNLTMVHGVPYNETPIASYGSMEEASQGKDSTTGHWEIAGIISKEGFKVYPHGFPLELLQRFVSITGCGGYYGNKPASGTNIIEEFHQAHKKTGYPIIYTSADSVFQIACDIDCVPLDVLYYWCETARALLDDGYDCSRVIARPYKESETGLERMGDCRKDYSVPPPPGSLLELIIQNGGRVTAVGKTEDLFVSRGVSHSIHTGSNLKGLETLISLLNNEINYELIKVKEVGNQSTSKELIFVNLVDTDMIYGHRRDPHGYASALEEIDKYLHRIISLIGDDDLLIITADHGCDPTAPGSDHTREKVPLLIFNPRIPVTSLGIKPSFSFVARRVAEWLSVVPSAAWAD